MKREPETTEDSNLDTPYVADLTLDRNSATPLYQQISAPIAALISKGEIAPGQLVEDELSLANRLQVSRPTARRAFQELAQMGLVVRRRGAGTRVTPIHIQRKIGLTSLKSDLIRSGHSTHTQVLSYNVTLADEQTACLLGAEEGIEVASIRRLRWANENPLAIMHNIIPIQFAPSLTELNEKGLYDSFLDKGIHITTAVQNIGARNATEEETKLLGLAPNSAMVTMERVAYDAAHQVIEYGNHVYDAAQYRITVPLTANIH
ncbi:GntR family transcriptional regulator [Arcanobacterium sp. S3PF19]|uniref:GntR family transcriptional regulator n=1 Tax=Arcanobacterium sp. S3PF19 TaxID=1219585 RepID=UPI00051045D6|nr:GntR family transcriptional regulator [Arcanobacterium sp. S3PF19]KGF06029.1 GntR family transcriptional regulator [Arcanobacterium sp. S3PF19]